MNNAKLLLFGAVATFGIYAQPLRFIAVNGVSMAPTYHDGQLAVATTAPKALHRGDVVIFNREDETFVKRVAFLPGDQFRQIFYAGEWLAPNNPTALRAALRQHYPTRMFKVPSDTVYVLGDNACESVDSRTFGPIPVATIHGRVLRGAQFNSMSNFPDVRFAKSLSALTL